MVQRGALDRLLNPQSIAIVGLSDNSHRPSRLTRNLESGCEVFIVNPRYERVMGIPTARSLTDLGRPVDCVMSVMSAERTTELAEEAAALDVGGLVLFPAGFGESGPNGVRLQERVRTAARAGGLAAIGPNCLGFENVPRKIRLSFAVEEDHNLGGISVVAQSGTMVTAITVAGNAQGAGFNLLISSGNEAVTDMADLVDYLADDRATKTIGLVIEKIHRPAAFFAAVQKAIAAGKPIVALKLGRNPRAQKIVASHTGSITRDAWVYDIALRQMGVSIARDPEDAADRLAIVEKIPASRWTRVESLGIVNLSGGFASMNLDIATEEGLSVPPLDDFLPWVQERIPSALVANPLDPTGLGVPHWPEILEHYITSPRIDAFFTTHPITKEDERIEMFVGPVAEQAARVAKPVVLSNSAGVPPRWINAFQGDALAYGNGVRGSLRGLQTIGSFVRYRERMRTGPVATADALPRPPGPVFSAAGGTILGFDATLRVLRAAGLPVAPHVLIEPDQDEETVHPSIDFDPPYAVKLANVAHRTEHGAVQLHISAKHVGQSVGELRNLARARGLSPVVAIQPMVAADGEVILGIKGDSELGPVVVCGPGGIFVEVLGRLGGRLAPFDLDEARRLIEEFRDIKIMHGFRGAPAWDLDALARILVNAGQLAVAGRDWIESLDINPILYTQGEFVAVDALLVLR
jgi:acyl-CoA synthetase (NDP forming)